MLEKPVITIVDYRPFCLLIPCIPKSVMLLLTGKYWFIAEVTYCR
jgi:hypothetical protein